MSRDYMGSTPEDMCESEDCCEKSSPMTGNCAIGESSSLSRELRAMNETKKGQVFNEFQRLRELNQVLQKELMVLRKKLSPVLHQENPESCGDKCSEPSGCELAAGIRKEANDLEESIEVVRRMQRDLQV